MSRLAFTTAPFTRRFLVVVQPVYLSYLLVPQHFSFRSGPRYARTRTAFTPAITRRSLEFTICLVVKPVVNDPPRRTSLLCNMFRLEGIVCASSAWRSQPSGATDRAAGISRAPGPGRAIGCRGSRFRLLPRIALRAWVSGSAVTTAPIARDAFFSLYTRRPPGGRVPHARAVAASGGRGSPRRCAAGAVLSFPPLGWVG